MAEISVHHQSDFWSRWIQRSRSWELNEDNERRAAYVLTVLHEMERTDVRILDVGCGSGWLALELASFGTVTATDLASQAIDRLKREYPHITWVGGNFLKLEWPRRHFDFAACLETIAHVPDQALFAERIARAMRVGAPLVLTSQNKYVWSRTSWLKPRAPGQIRDWPSRRRLRALFQPYFNIRSITTCAPGGDRGLPRIVNHRMVAALAESALGTARWTCLRERAGLGRSLVMIADRNRRPAP